MRIKSRLFYSLAIGFSVTSFAVAAPQTGTWLVANGQNAYGGDIINIDVQDSAIFVTFAVGQVPNNTYFLYGRGRVSGTKVVLDLTSSKDLSVRRVTGTFDTSTTGVLNFPGVGERSVYRVKLNDETNPASLLGVWSFSNLPFDDSEGKARSRTLFSVVEGTAEGTGIVMDTTGSFGCEYKDRGELKGYIVCLDVENTSAPKSYLLKRSANEAAGYYGPAGSIIGSGYAHKLVSADGEAILFLKKSDDSARAMNAAMHNFSYNYGNIVKKMISN